MTIRSTVNATIINKNKHHSAVPGRSQSIEHVSIAGINTEKRDVDDREVDQSTTPSHAHNGRIEPVPTTTLPP